MKGNSGKLVIALAGNPNSGKTTLFNALTGSTQRVGNWPGVTVEKKSGVMRLGERSADARSTGQSAATRRDSATALC